MHFLLVDACMPTPPLALPFGQTVSLASAPDDAKAFNNALKATCYEQTPLASNVASVATEETPVMSSDFRALTR